MFNLFPPGNKYQQLARQHNANLVECNGKWLLYQDGKLIYKAQYPWDAVQILAK